MKKVIVQNAILSLVEGEAFAGVALNPTYVWAKAVVTDSLPNENKMRVPQEEFANINLTGKYSPVKLSDNGPAGHFESMGKPVGVFTDFVEIGNQVHTLIALWGRERESDIAELKEQLDQGKPPQLSWELYYDPDISETDENGILNLRGITFNGAAVVRNPAYAGRTPIYAFASQDEENKEMELELESKVTELETLLSEKEALIAEKEALLAEKEAELLELRNFKDSVEAEAGRLVKLDGIKNKFAENKITKPETYFEDNKEMLLGLSEDALNFIIQEMVAFASASASVNDAGVLNIPNLVGDETETAKNPKKLALALKALKQNK